jgi:hypothetical protein
MKELKKHLNYSLVVYNNDGKVWEKLDGPGDCGTWFSGPDSPVYAALFIIDHEKIDDHLIKNELGSHLAGRIPFDDNDVEYPEKEEKGILVEVRSKEHALEIAKEFGLEFFYWMFWDPARVIDIVDVKTGEEEPYCNGEYD